jgi:hypothetical protein
MESQSRMRIALREDLSPLGVLSDYLITLGYILAMSCHSTSIAAFGFS